MDLGHTLTRDEILRGIDWLRHDPEFVELLPTFLRSAIDSIDLQLAKCLLEAGASPNEVHSLGDGPLHWLFEEYLSARTTRGSEILSLVSLLLAHGCDPNQVGCNNYRAYDLAVRQGCNDYARLLASAGALPELRAFV